MNRRVGTIGLQTGAAEAKLLMDRHRLSSVPVVDRMGTLCGVVLDEDLPRFQNVGSAQRACKFMRIPAGVVGPHTPLTTAARLMRARDAPEFLVIDEGGRLIGVVSLGDAVADVPAPGDEVSTRRLP